MKTTSRMNLVASAPLWASAFVLIGLILVQSARTLGNRAQAEMVSASGGYTVLTADGGTDEVLILLDERSEELYVYRVENQRSVDMKERVSLSRLFTDARAAAQGG